MSVTIAIEQQALAERHLDTLPELVEALDASSVDECVDCGMKLGGLLGMFQWGIIHGQGKCSACGFPYVYYHYQQLAADDAEELRLCAWIPNAPMPLATSDSSETEKATE